MDVSSGNLQIPHFVAQKMDEEFSGIFFLLITSRTVKRGTRMLGDKEEDAWSRFECGTLGENIFFLSGQLLTL